MTGAGGELVTLRVEPAEGGASVDPWPFAAEAVTVGCEGRRLDGRFADGPALHAALAAAPAVELSWTLRPA